jgi:hypothetical protein
MDMPSFRLLLHHLRHEKPPCVYSPVAVDRMSDPQTARHEPGITKISSLRADRPHSWRILGRLLINLTHRPDGAARSTEHDVCGLHGHRRSASLSSVKNGPIFGDMALTLSAERRCLSMAMLLPSDSTDHLTGGWARLLPFDGVRSCPP